MPATLVTGGAGYIGSHVATALAAAGRDFVILDNHVNSSPVAIERVTDLIGRKVHTYDADIRDVDHVRDIVRNHDVDSVIHMAGLKAVGESVDEPLRYYDNNVAGTMMMLRALQDTACRKFVFSSSATVYGAAEHMPIDESCPTGPTNPYGMTKLMIEHVLRDLSAADASWKIVNLRYFNPVGAHESGRIGENPSGIPNNLMPFVSQVAAGKRAELRVFGNDWPTPDGTGVRDYIHVLDLADGHVKALAYLDRGQADRLVTVNLGTGRGYSVFDMVRAFEKVGGVRIPYSVVARRPGDIATCYANPAAAEKILGWKAQRGIEDMCRDAWRWQSANPNGYR